MKHVTCCVVIVADVPVGPAPLVSGWVAGHILAFLTLAKVLCLGPADASTNT